jgi:hypothetical protein
MKSARISILCISESAQELKKSLDPQSKSPGLFFQWAFCKAASPHWLLELLLFITLGGTQFFLGFSSKFQGLKPQCLEVSVKLGKTILQLAEINGNRSDGVPVVNWCKSAVEN